MRIPLLARIGMAFIFVGGALLFYAVYWLPAHPLVAFNKPVSLSPGRIATGAFEVAPGYSYYVEIETDWTAKTFPPGCDWHSVLKTQWTLSYDSEVYQPERGYSPWDTSSLTITTFLSETSRYSFDATILPGADCLNAGHPRLLIQTHPQQNDSYIYMIWFSVWCLAIGLASLAIVGFHARWRADRPPRMLPEMVLRNILPWQRHSPMPLMKGLPDFGLVFGFLFFIFMVIFMIVHRVTPTGLFVHVRQQNAAPGRGARGRKLSSSMSTRTISFS